MEQVVEGGTAKGFVKIPGYTVAGKTGTANKLIDGRYSNDTYASFVGFLPSRNPAVAILVVLDSPHGKNGHFGAPVSGPIFTRIAEATLTYLGIPPTVNPAPPVLVSRPADASPRPTATGAGGSAEGSMVSLVSDGPPGTVPDVSGMSAREAIRKLVMAGLSPQISGDGVVVSQSPQPGTPIESGDVCVLMLDRVRSHASAVGAAMTWIELRDLVADRGLKVSDTGPGPGAGAGTVAGIAYDSRRVEPGQVFVALKGLHADGTAFAREAITRGALAVIAERAGAAGNRRSLDGRQRRAARAGARRREVLRRSERRHAGRRHHRHQRQDHDGLSGGLDL